MDLSVLLQEAISEELPYLRTFPEDVASVKPAAGWSPKEELGHLIDSAANNHIRFVLATLEPELRGPGYAQDDWVSLHGYQEMPWEEIVEVWFHYNALLARLVGRIPEEALTTTCFIGKSDPATLGFVIEDYVLHMRHHIDHLLGREKITEYPSAKKTI
jgi:hypothetical protein